MKKLRILLVVGDLLLVAALIWAGNSYWYITRGVQTTGTIIDLISTGRSTHSVLSFTTVEGTYVEKKLASGGEGLTVGEKIQVYYHPNKPERFRVDWFVNLWLGPLLLGIAGVTNLGLGIFLPIILRHRQL